MEWLMLPDYVSFHFLFSNIEVLQMFIKDIMLSITFTKLIANFTPLRLSARRQGQSQGPLNTPRCPGPDLPTLLRVVLVACKVDVMFETPEPGGDWRDPSTCIAVSTINRQAVSECVSDLHFRERSPDHNLCFVHTLQIDQSRTFDGPSGAHLSTSRLFVLQRCLLLR